MQNWNKSPFTNLSKQSECHYFCLKYFSPKTIHSLDNGLGLDVLHMKAGVIVFNLLRLFHFQATFLLP